MDEFLSEADLAEEVRKVVELRRADGSSVRDLADDINHHYSAVYRAQTPGNSNRLSTRQKILGLVGKEIEEHKVYTIKKSEV